MVINKSVIDGNFFMGTLFSKVEGKVSADAHPSRLVASQLRRWLKLFHEPPKFWLISLFELLNDQNRQNY